MPQGCPQQQYDQIGFWSAPLVFWSLMVVVTGKYVVLVMRADNEGRRIMALLGLAAHGEPNQWRRTALLLFGSPGQPCFMELV